MKWNRRKSFCGQKLFRRLEFPKILAEIGSKAPQSNQQPICRSMSLLMKNLTMILGEKAYIAGTNANNCILGASIVKNADETDLTKAYGVFKQETIEVEPNYAPLTITSLGKQATQNAWKTLFSSILLIRCFLHIFIGVFDRTKNKFKDIFMEISEKLWNCFKSPDKRTYSKAS